MKNKKMSIIKMDKKLFSLVVVIFAGPLLINKAAADNILATASSSPHPQNIFSTCKVIDLTQTINASIPTYDDKPGSYKYETLSSVDKDGYASGAFFTHEHLGTHIDAPIHFYPGKKSIEKLSANDLVLPTVVIDVRDEVIEDPDYLLSINKLEQFEKSNHIPVNCAVLLLTGWSKHYWLAQQYRNADKNGVMHFPGFSLEAAKYLLDKYKVKALGIDTLSIDSGPSEDFAVHKLVLAQGLYLVENLTNLDCLPSLGATTIFAPLKIEGGTGSPARVLALIPNTRSH